MYCILLYFTVLYCSSSWVAVITLTISPHPPSLCRRVSCIVSIVFQELLAAAVEEEEEEEVEVKPACW